MRDVHVPIYRPVALPQKFFGAPAMPALLNFMFAPFLLMGSATFEFFFPPFFIFLGIFTHFLLMMWGSREPHLTTLIQTGHKSRKTPRNYGRRSKTHTFQP
jgi:hypothetical protein